jgi:hypothetical protein
MESGQELTILESLISILATLSSFVCPVARIALAAKFIVGGKEDGL